MVLLTLLGSGLDGMGLNVMHDVHGKTFIKVFTIPHKTPLARCTYYKPPRVNSKNCHAH